ncbi:uncharacterized protein [Tenebrio molitor]|uniref:uncharacterized protein n=1 Tax=Tenebrio molitor TaxID=7067 RepID=UPI001C3BF93C|nr:unnamed protein product [Tenebrio molitor]
MLSFLRVAGMKYLTLFLTISLLTVDHGDSLHCYATDIQQMLTGQFFTTLEDCAADIQNIMRLQTVQLTQVPKISDYRCYKVIARKGDTTVSVNGCIPPGGCSDMRTLLNELLHTVDTECYECTEEGCNSAQKFASFGFLVGALAALLFVC